MDTAEEVQTAHIQKLSLKMNHLDYHPQPYSHQNPCSNLEDSPTVYLKTAIFLLIISLFDQSTNISSFDVVTFTLRPD